MRICLLSPGKTSAHFLAVPISFNVPKSANALLQPGDYKGLCTLKLESINEETLGDEAALF